MLFLKYVYNLQEDETLHLFSLSLSLPIRLREKKGEEEQNIITETYTGGVKEVRPPPGGQIKNRFDENVCIIISIPSPYTIIQMIRLSYSRYFNPFQP